MLKEHTLSSAAFPQPHQFAKSHRNNGVLLPHLGDKEGTILSINHVVKALLHLLMQHGKN